MVNIIQKIQMEQLESQKLDLELECTVEKEEEEVARAG